MNDSIGLLDPVESDILRAFFGLRTRLPDRDALLEPLDAGAPGAEADEEEGEAARDRRGVRIRRDLRSPDFPGDAPLANAVARICLNAIQSRLPNWIGVTSDGKVVTERTLDPSRPASGVALPRHVLTIHWTDSGPGGSWPEAYHATYLPEFHRYVITASVDCAETWGATDFAIGVVGEREEFLRACGTVVRGWWRYQRALGDQPPWASVLSPGIVDLATARAWRARTWASEVCAERV